MIHISFTNVFLSYKIKKNHYIRLIIGHIELKLAF